MTFGERLYQIRTDKGIKASFLARKMDCSEQAIYRYEEGNRLPPLKKFGKLCKVLKITPSEFLEGVEL